VLAPLGTIALDRPEPVKTSTSIVGFPLESRTSLALIFIIWYFLISTPLFEIVLEISF